MLYLNASEIHGVGLFTDKPIKRGEVALVWDENDYRTIPVKTVRADLKKYFDKHGVRQGSYYEAPKDFMRMFVGWYLNHQDKPNIVSFDDGATYLAMMDIKKDGELTIDYDLL